MMIVSLPHACSLASKQYPKSETGWTTIAMGLLTKKCATINGKEQVIMA